METNNEAAKVEADYAAPPFADNGVGGLMLAAGQIYLDDYVLDCESHDHEPTPFERQMLEDFMNGLMNDEAMFGPVRTLLADHASLKEEVARLKNGDQLTNAVTCANDRATTAEAQVAELQRDYEVLNQSSAENERDLLESFRAKSEAVATLTSRLEALEAGLNEFADFADLVEAETEGFEDSDPVALVLVPDEKRPVEMMRLPILAFRQARALLSKEA